MQKGKRGRRRKAEPLAATAASGHEQQPHEQASLQGCDPAVIDQQLSMPPSSSASLGQNAAAEQQTGFPQHHHSSGT